MARSTYRRAVISMGASSGRVLHALELPPHTDAPTLQAMGVLCRACHKVVPLLLFLNSPARPRKAHCPHCSSPQELAAE